MKRVFCRGIEGQSSIPTFEGKLRNDVMSGPVKASGAVYEQIEASCKQ